MTQQTTFADITAPDRTPQPTSEPETQAEFIARTEEYAAEIANEHFPDLPVETVEWEVSTRAERAAGRTKYNRKTEEIIVRLAWAAFEKFGWKKMQRTIRHELIHAWEYHKYGDSSHGVRFRTHADDLDVDIYCERFKTPRYWIVCEDCEKRDPRYKRSKVVKQPDRYSCQCGGDITVEATERA